MSSLQDLSSQPQQLPQDPGSRSQGTSPGGSSTDRQGAAPSRFINSINQEDTDEIDALRAKGDNAAADRLLDKQRDQLAVGHAVALAFGQDPDKWRPPQATGLHPEIELEAWAHKRARLMAGQKRIYDEEGLSKVTDLRRTMVQTYKRRHDANVTGDPNESMPLEWDPNELADARFRIARIHNRIRKEVDPSFNAYTDPFLSSLSQSMTEGNLAVSGAQPMRGDYGAVGEAAELAFAPIRGALDAGFEFGYGLASLGNRVIQGISGGQLGLHVQEPTHGVVDEDGKLWTNSGKVAGFGHLAAMAQAMVYGQVTEDVAQLGETIALKDAQRHGLERFAHGTAYGIGAFGAMGVGAAPFAALARKGLTWLGSGGLGLHAIRSQKILDIASSALGMAPYEAIAKGESDGYGKAGLHGMVLGALAGGLGLLGRRTEAFLTQQKVPAIFARAVAGATEGFGFSVPTQELWDFIKDPSKETWSRYAGMAAVNIAAMGLLKTFGQTPSEHLLAPEQMPRTKSPAPRELQREAASEIQKAEDLARNIAGKKEAVVQPPSADVQPPVATDRPEGRTLSKRELSRDLMEISRRLTDNPDDPGLLARRAITNAHLGEIESARIDLKAAKRWWRERYVSAEEYKSIIEEAESVLADTEVSPTILTEMAAPRARESYPVEGREGRVLPVIEHKGGVAEGQGRQTEASAGASVAKALEEGLPSRYRDERELSHGEAMQQKMEERRKGQRGRDPLEDPEFQRLPEDIKSKLLATKDVGERMKIWNESAERVLRPEIEALQQKIAAEGRAASLDDMRALSLRAMGTPLEGEVRTITHGAPIVKEKKGFQVPAEASREAKFYKEQLEARDKKAREAERFAEFGRKLRSAEQAKQRPELKKLAFEAQQEARQEIAVEVRGPKSPERLQEEREDLHAEVVASQSFPAARGTAPVEGAEPIRASDIAKRAQGVLPGHPIKFALRFRRQGHWARGWYSSQEKLVRSGEANDLNNIAHEFGHAMQDQTIGLRWKPGKGPLRNELLDIGRPLYRESMPMHRKIAEAWAEFWARDLLGDASLDASYPAAARFMRAWMAAPEQAAVREQYLHLKEGYQQYRDQGSVSRVRQSWRMVGDKPSPEQRALLGSKWTRAKKWLDRFSDDNAKIRHAMKAEGIEVGELPVDMDVYRMASINRMRSAGVAETFIWRATLGAAGKRTGEGLKQALEQIKESERDDFVTYWIARSSLELQERGFKTQLPREDYLAAVDTLGNERFENAVQRAKEWSDRLIDYAAYHGALDEVSANKIKDSGGVYVPMFRALEGPERAGRPQRGVAEKGSGVGFRKGSSHEIRDPLQAMMEITQSVIQKAHKAQVMKALYTLHVVEPGLGGLVTEVPRDVRPINLDVKETKAALEKLGFDVTLQEGLDESQIASIITLFEPEARPSGHEAIIAHTPKYSEAEIAQLGREYGTQVANKLEKVNGKARWLEVSNDMFEGLMGLDAENAMNVPAAMTFATRLMKLGFTGIKPAFTAINMVRDTILLPLFSSTEKVTRFIPIFGGAVEMVAGARAQLKGRTPLVSRLLGSKGNVDPIAQVLMDAGGKGSTFMREATISKGKSYEGLLHRSAAERAKQTLVHPARAALKGLDILERALAEPESFARTNEGRIAHQRALDEGKTEEQAFLEGLEAFQEVTQNFIRTGPQVRAASRVIAYTSARVGSYRRLGRTLLGYEGREKQLRAIGQGLLNISTIGAISYLLFGDEDWHQDRPEWRKNNFWSFKFGDTIMDIPKPFEMGALFSNPVEWTLGKLAGRDKKTVFEMVGGMLVNELRSFASLPSLIGPSIELWANKSMFTGRSIVPEWMEDRLPPEKREQVYTTWIAKQIGHAIGVSPIQVEYLLSAHTGGLATRFARTADELFGLREQLRSHDVSTTQEELAEIPFIGAFFGQHAHEQSAAVQQLYDLHKELNQNKQPRTEALRLEIGRAKKQLSDIFKLAREGRISRQEADERAFKIAEPLVDRYERMRD